jgi:hypothetical protein
MRWFGTFLWLALAPAVVFASRAPKPPTDVLGRPIPVVEGRPVLTFYVNRDNRSLMREKAVQLAFDARASAPVVVVHVDLRDIPGWFHGMAKREIRKSWQECLGDVARLYRQANEKPPSWLADALFMVADDNGEPHVALGLPKRFRQPWAVAVSSGGRELARGPFATVIDGLTRTLTHSSRMRGEVTAR